MIPTYVESLILVIHTHDLFHELRLYFNDLKKCLSLLVYMILLYYHK